MEHDASMVRRHEGQFERLDARVLALEVEMTRHDALLVRLDADIYNHGKEGMKTVLSSFITEIRTEKKLEKEQRNREHKANTRKLNTLMVIATAGLFFIATLTLFLTYETSKHSQMDPAKIFHSKTADPFFSYDHQSATIPALRR